MQIEDNKSKRVELVIKQNSVKSLSVLLALVMGSPAVGMELGLSGSDQRSPKTPILKRTPSERTLRKIFSPGDETILKQRVEMFLVDHNIEGLTQFCNQTTEGAQYSILEYVKSNKIDEYIKLAQNDNDVCVLKKLITFLNNERNEKKLDFNSSKVIAQLKKAIDTINSATKTE